jgi:hypothetical protein
MLQLPTLTDRCTTDRLPHKDPPPHNTTTSGGVADRANRRTERAQIYPQMEGAKVRAGFQEGRG